METRKRILRVPPEFSLRNRLRKEVKCKLANLDLQPPVAFEPMEELALEIVQSIPEAKDYLDFCIVLVGNELWRPIVNSIPYNRRLLLLPQCLKNTVSCKGFFDEMGLNCAGCKACSIDDILTEAEALGYITLVAEGTSVALFLVEEGSIDAVIGVSCMPVLQRSFEPVSKAAIPVLGLPLMYDGCTNTKIDLHWLRDEIHGFDSNPKFFPLSVYGVHQEVLRMFNADELKQFFSEPGIGEQAVSLLLLGGRRLRPLLGALAYRAYSLEPDENLERQLLVVLECFHKASLVHDDIQDETMERYQQVAYHVQNGVAKAINMGDFMIGKGYQLLTSLSIPGEIKAKAIQQVAQSHVFSTIGQEGDIDMALEEKGPDLEEVLEIFQNKTGEAIKVALLLGAMLGGADQQELKLLTRFANNLGVAYQIKDDLKEYDDKLENEKVADFPFLQALLNEKIGQKVKDVDEFRAQMQKYALPEEGRKWLEHYVHKCYRELDGLQNKRMRLALYALVGRLFKQTELHGS